MSVSGTVAEASCAPRTVVVARVGVIVAPLAALVALISPGRPLSLIAVMAFAVLGFGPTVTSWLDSGDPFAQTALTVIISLAGYALLATLLIWWRLWHPDLLLVLAIPTTISCVQRIRVWKRARGGPQPRPRP